MSRNAEDIFLGMGIAGGVAAVTNAAAEFIRVHPLYIVPPSSQDISENELKVLEEGGFPPVIGDASLSDNMAIIAGEVGVMIAGAMSQSQAAQLMGVDESRIRQRISHGTLYAMKGNHNKKVLPRFQFMDTGVIPGLEKILPAINKDAHPVAVQRFFVTANDDLYSNELKTNLSPRDWLISAHSPDPIQCMATDL
ncbi:MAG: hypothetical protein GXP08_12440 [Gammaproteobacteria bacterium]|nr:hypothetical protein [Gammaproteobacteria bacterium]